MRSFKKILLMLLILLGMESILGSLLEPVTYANYLEQDLKQMKAAGEQPDVVLLGDSRIYRSFVPAVFDEKFDGGAHCTINTGSGSQSMRGTFFYLKDLLKRYPIKYAIVGLTYTAFQTVDHPSIQSDLVVLDRIKDPAVKLAYISNAMSAKELPYLLKSYRYRGKIAGIPENVRTKLSEEYRQGIDTRPGEHYEDRGYVWSESGFREGETGMPSPDPMQWEEAELDQEAIVWLDRIRELCRQQGAELIFVTGPTTLSTIYSVREYEKSYVFFREYAARWGVPYFELNLLKDRKRLLPDVMMRDSDHVCGAGAEQISALFCDILNAYLAGKDTSAYFYASVEEMKQDIHAVVACDFHTEEIAGSQDRNWYAVSLQQEDEKAEYEFLIATGMEEKNWEVLQPYSRQSQCRIPGEKLCSPVWLRVNARLEGSNVSWEAYMSKMRTPQE